MVETKLPSRKRVSALWLVSSVCTSVVDDFTKYNTTHSYGVYGLSLVSAMLCRQRHWNERTLRRMPLPAPLTWFLVFEFVLTPYIFLLLVLEDLDLYHPGTELKAAEFQVQPGHSQCIEHAKTILAQSFKFGVHLWPQFFGDVNHADPRKNFDSDLLITADNTNLLHI